MLKINAKTGLFNGSSVDPMLPLDGFGRGRVDFFHNREKSPIEGP